MSLAHLLEDFGRTTVADLSSGPVSIDDLEAFKLDAFEEGYKAGWEDAIKSRAEEQAQISEDLARNLQDLSFTFHEARSHVIAALTPVLSDLAASVLPEIARDSLVEWVAEELRRSAESAAAQRVEIVTTPAESEALQSLLQQDFGFPLAFTADPGMSAGQVLLRFAREERQIDMAEILASIRAALAAFLDDTTSKEAEYG